MRWTTTRITINGIQNQSFGKLQYCIILYFTIITNRNVSCYFYSSIYLVALHTIFYLFIKSNDSNGYFKQSYNVFKPMNVVK